ncbi:pentatricopeptide repeat-containing protein At1g55630-like [Macadamia integrifolia]|uniref:pentatricopeptide repeat-containing protein At1g55630-like n=1 Tax=Macadamia integrifolia TaxID=60698 RepID=UPI001C4FECFB|nr:pentatricopeptide repeat-containing protein At1g55630-like [Macadamia integrifolia]XP_042507153.1 pentatricopeptide repeat-containing protein At1g55630-like [Macadamia integrifolia]XP_042507154.1 pentatricopeptide repeat-containing protein At1g55630-like [Macadamia integrifolia]
MVLTMRYMVMFGQRVHQSISYFCYISRSLCDRSFRDDGGDNGCEVNDSFPKGGSLKLDFDSAMHMDPTATLPEMSIVGIHDSDENGSQEDFSHQQRVFNDVRFDADRILEILHQDEPGFDVRLALDELQLGLSTFLVREVLKRILKTINHTNRNRSAKLSYKFFVWASLQSNYSHTSNTYHLLMSIFANCQEWKAMGRLVDQMTEYGLPTTARTFNILICAFSEAGMRRRLVERFITSKTFNYRPFKHSYNAILHSLLAVKQYNLIEWLYRQMLVNKHSPDVLSYNILLCAKYRLGKLLEFQTVLDEMLRSGFFPDFHTYNILLHVLGKDDKPCEALKLLNHMREVGCEPNILHFTTLMDGLSRAGNLVACQYFFDEMVRKGYMPDVVCYTVMITGYIVAGELENAQKMFDEMIVKGQLPNAFTYNSMIRGLCMAQKFEEARAMLDEMESRCCSPNFIVYRTLVANLRNAGKQHEAYKVVEQMVKKGHYIHLRSKLEGYVKESRRRNVYK